MLAVFFQGLSIKFQAYSYMDTPHTHTHMFLKTSCKSKAKKIYTFTLIRVTDTKKSNYNISEAYA